jgi:hypothetical protein
MASEKARTEASRLRLTYSEFAVAHFINPKYGFQFRLLSLPLDKNNERNHNSVVTEKELRVYREEVPFLDDDEVVLAWRRPRNLKDALAERGIYRPPQGETVTLTLGKGNAFTVEEYQLVTDALAGAKEFDVCLRKVSFPPGRDPATGTVVAQLLL